MFNLTTKSQLIKESVWIIAGQMSSIFGNLLFIKIVTSKLNPSDYGSVSLVLSISIFFSQVLFGGIGSGISRFYSVADSKQDFKAYFIDSTKIVLKTSQFLLYLGILIALVLGINGDETFLYLIILGTMISIFNGINSVLSNFQNAARQRAVVAIHNGVGILVKILISILFFSLFGSNELSLIKSVFLAAFIVLLSQIIFFKFMWFNKKVKNVKANYIHNWSKDIWSYSLSVVVWNGFMALYQLSDKWALNLYSSLDEVGIYTVLFQLGYTPAFLIMTNILTFLSPIVYSHAGDGKDQDKNIYLDRIISKLITLTIIVTTVGVIASFFLHELLFRILVGTSYLNSSYLLPYFVLSAGIFSAGQVYNLKMESKIMVKEMILAKVITATIGIGLNFLLASFYGFIGVLIASIAYSIINFLGMLLISSDKNYFVKFKFKKMA